MKPLLVLGDIHHRCHRADALIREHGQGHTVVFLGDYFDSYGDTPVQAAETAAWLSQSLGQPDRVHLLGNHDLPYFFPEVPAVRCPGYTEEKRRAMAGQLDLGAALRHFRLAFASHGCLFSHAGFHPRWLRRHVLTTSAEVVADEANNALRSLPWLRDPAWFQVGASRGGIPGEVGGPLWLDWAQEFRPVPGLRQMVGHTPYPGYLRAKGLDARGICCDLNINQPGPLPLGWSVPPQNENWCVDSHLALALRVRPDGRVEVVG